jgi:microsomal dipeptidase-like Zn-dependent dipeptidase
MGYTRYAVGVMSARAVGMGTHFTSTLSPWVTDGLLRAGFSDAEIGAIMGGKNLRVLRQVLPA